MQVGIMARTFYRPTLSEMLDVIVSYDIYSVQFSFGCVGLPELPEHIDLKLCDEIRDEMEKHKITISAMSGTCNMIDPDINRRKDGLKRLSDLISVCDHLGASVMSLCTGTRDPQNMWMRHPDNDTEEAFRDIVASFQEVLEVAEKHKVILGFEPEVSNVIDSGVKGKRLIDELKSPFLKVVMDGANVFHKGELPKMQAILDETFELLGEHIIIAHAKDLDHDGDAGHLPAGKGLLDYDHYISLLKRYKPDVPVILHGLSEQEAGECVSFLRAKMGN
jgi:sugar phosphate isomerase/epimerase